MLGGTGVVPCGPAAGSDCVDRFTLALVVVDLTGDAPAARRGLTPLGLEIADGRGAVLARMWRVVAVDALPAPVGPGTTRLRVRALVERWPRGPGLRFRLTLGAADGGRVVISGHVSDDTWATA
jgi:hypothetical protein